VSHYLKCLIISLCSREGNPKLYTYVYTLHFTNTSISLTIPSHLSQDVRTRQAVACHPPTPHITDSTIFKMRRLLPFPLSG
jgi:hypothetical protein